MNRIPASEVQQLKITEAIQEEARAWRNLVPPEPWLKLLSANPSGLAEWVGARLESGARNAPAYIVNTNKAGSGMRPVPVVGIGERIAYRALTTSVLQDMDLPTRSVGDYHSFILGPIDYAFQGPGPTHRIRDARLGYVVETDIAAFYQYIDHEILLHELELQTGRVRDAGRLIELLAEIQGATFGLPQLLNPSDELAEIYASMLERDVVRQGLHIWRYSDDFRIGVNRYDEAQRAVERLSDAARRLGLVLNENKTFIFKFINYLVRYIDAPVDDDDAQIDPSKADIGNGDYTDDATRVESAIGILNRLNAPPSNPARIDLKNLRRDDFRELRGALNTLTKNREPSAMSYLVPLLLFAPALTPRICEYMIAMHGDQPDEVSAMWDRLIRGHTSTLSDWQWVWLTYVARTCNLLQGSTDERVPLLKARLANDADGLLHAELSLCLAQVGAMHFTDLDVAIRVRPEPFAPWYVLGVRSLMELSAVSDKQVNALKGSSPLYRLLMEC